MTSGNSEAMAERTHGPKRARAPVRIDLAGGWSDVPPFSAEAGGAVVNVAITRYSYATLFANDTGEFILESADYDQYIHAKDIRELEYNGSLDLLKAAVRRMKLDFGGHLITRSDAPPGSGIGSSASMGVALVGLLDAMQGGDLSRMDIAAMANLLEVDELGIDGGKQDQYAAACGGLSFMTFEDPDVTVDRLEPSRDFLLELEKSMLLVYTGKSRLSGDIISTVMGAYQRNEQAMTEPLMNLRHAAYQMRDAISAEDLERVGEVLDLNWENQKRLYDEMTTPKIEALFSVARPAGLLGGKACGAGGGGCIALLCCPDREHVVRRQVQDLGGQCIDFNFDCDGLQVWQPVTGTSG
ncbi:MAG: GHMP kinase [Armatimonadota bacterium]